MVRTLIRRFLGHELISGAAFIFLGSLVGNLMNFLFNLFMTRNLTVSDYGSLASMISLMTLTSIPAGAVFPTVVRFAASYFAKKEETLVRGLFFKVTKPFFLIGVLVLIFFYIFRYEIAHFFNINDTSLIVLAAFSVTIGFVGVANQPLLQAKLAFRFISFINILSSFLKFSLGLMFVLLGLRVAGAMWALLFSTIIPYIVSFFPLSFLFDKKMHTPRISTKELFSYGMPAALASFCITSLISTDIILVKHFFEPQQAGIYAGLSLVGRVIYFLSAPIGTVMFPLIVRKHIREENYHELFKFSFILVLIPSVMLTIFYFLFPEFVIGFFTRKEYIVASGYLGLFAIFISMFSLLLILTNFFLSIKKTEIAIPIAIGALVQAILIWFYHQSLTQIISISLFVVSLLLFLLLVYYIRTIWQGK